LLTIELDESNDDDELPTTITIPSQKGARAKIPTKPARTKLSYQLGAFVKEKEVYVSASIITIASFDYNSLSSKLTMLLGSLLSLCGETHGVARQAPTTASTARRRDRL
jgi:hypothetical protein